MTVSKLFGAFLTAGIALLGQHAGAATTLVSADLQRPAYPSVRAAEHMAQLVAQQSKGDLNIAVKAQGSAGSEHEALRAVLAGSLAMTRLSLGALADQAPTIDLASMPYLFRSNEHMQAALKGELGQRIDRELDHLGLVRLMYLDSAPRDFYCTQPIRTLDDFRGRKIRVLSSKVFDDLVRTLGAKPVDLPFDKVAEAFKAGAIDCAAGDAINYVEAGLHKEAPYLMQDEHVRVPDVLLLSKKVWLTLTPAQQAILRSAASQSMESMSKQWQEEEAGALAVAKKAGATVIPKSQLPMVSIQEKMLQNYNKYATRPEDLQLILNVIATK